MTEQEWWACHNFRQTLVWVLHKGTTRRHHRKLRLFTCACVRAVGDRLADEWGARAVAAAEQLADGIILRQALDKLA